MHIKNYKVLMHKHTTKRANAEKSTFISLRSLFGSIILLIDWFGVVSSSDWFKKESS